MKNACGKQRETNSNKHTTGESLGHWPEEGEEMKILRQQGELKAGKEETDHERKLEMA